MTTLDNSGLLSCPFCGGVAIITNTIAGKFLVECELCGASIEEYGILEEAKKTWNTRLIGHGDDPQAPAP